MAGAFRKSLRFTSSEPELVWSGGPLVWSGGAKLPCMLSVDGAYPASPAVLSNHWTSPDCGPGSAEIGRHAAGCPDKSPGHDEGEQRLKF